MTKRQKLQIMLLILRMRLPSKQLRDKEQMRKLAGQVIIMPHLNAVQPELNRFPMLKQKELQQRTKQQVLPDGSNMLQYKQLLPLGGI